MLSECVFVLRDFRALGTFIAWGFPACRRHKLLSECVLVLRDFRALGTFIAWGFPCGGIPRMPAAQVAV